MRPFKFFKKPFNCEDYDITDFRFLGVTPIYLNDDGRASRKMIYVLNENGSITLAQTIHDDHDAYHMADIYEVRGNQVFLLPRVDMDHIELRFSIASAFITDPIP